MGSRRFTMAPTSDEEDEPPLPPQRQRKQREEEVEDRSQARGRKRMKLQVDDEEAEEEGSPRSRDEMKKKKKEEEAEPKSEEEGGQEDAIPIGEVMRISGKGKGRRRHYKAFEFDRNCFQLEDPVLIVPEATDQKPYVAVIKDITQTTDGSMMVRGRWFYRPEEAERKGGGSWQSSDTRELFYSFHHDEVPAESVMHKCVVHFVPLHKQLPNRKNYPGFIVQKVYDTVAKRLYKLTDKDYEDELQREIDLLVKKTMARLGSLPDIEAEDPAAEQEQLRSKKTFRKKNITPLDVTRPDDLTAKSDQYLKAETPGICSSNMSEYYKILVMFKAFTGETQRDKWLEKLLQAVQSVCNSSKKEQEGDKGKLIPTRADHTNAMDSTAVAKEAQEKKVTESFVWPDAAVPAVSALERAAHDTLSSDFQKYNQKMRQLVFNLKSNAFLAGRLLNGELEPSRILNMSPVELKEGLTAEETARNEPEESECMQMTDARCKRCMEKKVGLIDIIQAGHGERYQLECIACGNTWYAPRDAVSVLTIDGPSSAKSIGTAPLATAKFEEVEKKKLGSPHDSDKPAADVFKKSTEAYMPVLETQKSFNKPKLEENRGPTKDD